MQVTLSDYLKARERRARVRRLFVETLTILVFVTMYFFVSTSINNTELTFESTSKVKELLLNSVYDDDGDGGGGRRRRCRARHSRCDTSNDQTVPLHEFRAARGRSVGGSSRSDAGQ